MKKFKNNFWQAGGCKQTNVLEKIKISLLTARGDKIKQLIKCELFFLKI